MELDFSALTEDDWKLVEELSRRYAMGGVYDTETKCKIAAFIKVVDDMCRRKAEATEGFNH